MKKFVTTLLALTCGVSFSQELTEVDRQLLLERLDDIQKSADSAARSRFSAAISAYRAAAASDVAANELWLKCWEKVDFQDEAKSAKNFREKRKEHKDKRDSPGFRRALRHQLNWLLLTIEISQDEDARTKMSDKAISAIENILADAKLLEGQGGLLRKSVLDSEFAKAYNLDGLQVENWSLAPLDVSSMYQSIILPPWQNSESVSLLKRGWSKRIEHEGLAIENFTREGEKDRKPAFEKWLDGGRLDLLWAMELDLFKYGNQREAALRMLDHVKKYLSHNKAPDWVTDFTGLVKGEIKPPELPEEEEAKPEGE
ncbi:hypothetical protein N9889_00460 [bacterium]|nr:hypothetical protein [Akkermansiaceae bacterium]MDB4266065.1 hypothetical protein [bacterium]MDA8876076.1 hypothetical protein [Akkermansiaceae bacterium]MDB4302394.1 hypothetical protein [bacterium]MDB4545840.1 hypothetical protein [Akkermansiaceae bacterium]